MVAGGALYNTARWARLRRAALARDLWRCRFCGVSLVEGRDDPASAVVDHIAPHRGDRDRFFDPANLQALCKGCHDGRKQRAEALGYDPTVGEDGWPVDPLHPSG